MKKSTKPIITIMHVITWIIFIGLCIQTGAILISSIVSLFINPDGAKDLYMDLNLYDVYNYDLGHYISLVSIIIFIAVFKALIFYTVIKIFLKINFSNPFSERVSKLITRIGYMALVIGLISIVANRYCDWLSKKGVDTSQASQYLDGGSEFMLLGGIIYIIALVFKKGIELQSEIDLTV